MQKQRTTSTTEVAEVEEIEVPPPADLAETDALLDKLNDVLGDEDLITQEVITDEEADADEEAFRAEVAAFAAALAAKFCQPQGTDRCPCGYEWANCIRGQGPSVTGFMIIEMG